MDHLRNMTQRLTGGHDNLPTYEDPKPTFTVKWLELPI